MYTEVQLCLPILFFKQFVLICQFFCLVLLNLNYKKANANKKFALAFYFLRNKKRLR